MLLYCLRVRRTRRTAAVCGSSQPGSTERGTMFWDRVARGFFALLWVTGLEALAEDRFDPSWMLVVQAGHYARQDTPVRVNLARNQLGNAVIKNLPDGPQLIRLREVHRGQPVGERVVAQVDGAEGTTG